MGRIITEAITEMAYNSFQAERFQQNPIIKPGMGADIGDNINGPSLIRVPDWVRNPLGRYYLYFAHHKGRNIRLAYSDRLEGPWTIYEPGALKLTETICFDHVASPDVHINADGREIWMYFHGPVLGKSRQVSLVAISKDGIHFFALRNILGDSYFRAFQWGAYTYAIARSGVLYRSSDGLKDFEPGPNPFRTCSLASRVRHTAVKLDKDVLSVFYSRIGDKPESILLSRIELTPDWKRWEATEPVDVIKPEMDYEGVDLPLEASREGAARMRVRQLRDPAVFSEGGRAYLLYSVAGESGIAIAELKEGY